MKPGPFHTWAIVYDAEDGPSMVMELFNTRDEAKMKIRWIRDRANGARPVRVTITVDKPTR